MNDTLSNQVRTAKFTSSGELKKDDTDEFDHKEEEEQNQSDNEEEDEKVI
jgi:hypothetical protein